MTDALRRAASPRAWFGLPRADRAVRFATAGDLEDWIADWLSPRLGVAGPEIDRHMPFTDYGLDSMIAVKMSGDLEEALGRPVSPAVAWEYPTISEVAAHLFEPAQRSGD